MRITGMKVNHRENPIGCDFPYLHFDWNVEDAVGKEAAWVQLMIHEVRADGSLRLVYDQGKRGPTHPADWMRSLSPRPGPDTSGR